MIPSVPNPYLMVESSGRRFPLGDGQSWAIGRGDGCAVMLDSRSVSRLHALIQRRDAGDLALVDLGSRNGSFVNGTRVSFPVTLNDDDKLLFGDQLLSFHNPARSESVLLPAETGPAERTHHGAAHQYPDHHRGGGHPRLHAAGAYPARSPALADHRHVVPAQRADRAAAGELGAEIYRRRGDGGLGARLPGARGQGSAARTARRQRDQFRHGRDQQSAGAARSRCASAPASTPVPRFSAARTTPRSATR